MGKKNREFVDSLIQNKRTYNYYLNRLTELALSRFEWKNVPKNIDVRFLEMGLFYKGYMVFFKDAELDEYLALNTSISGTWNVYNIPILRRAYATNGYQKLLTEKNSVIIFNNMLHLPCCDDIEMFARRLSDFDRTIDVNVNAQKTPVLIICDEKERLSMLNLYSQYVGNAPVIKGDTSLRPDSLKVLTTQAPYIADNVQTLKTQIWNEALTYLGISNINSVKKERLITDEVTRNMGATVASRNSALYMRQLACKQINEMFNLEPKMSVEFKEDFQIIDEEIITEREVEENE